MDLLATTLIIWSALGAWLYIEVDAPDEAFERLLRLVIGGPLVWVYLLIWRYFR